MVNLSNARDVLVTSTFFGLPELSAYAYDICKQSINAESIGAWVEWCEVQSGHGQGQGQGQGTYGNIGPNGHLNGHRGNPMISADFASDSGASMVSAQGNVDDYASKLQRDM
jgi:hypothetical protein